MKKLFTILFLSIMYLFSSFSYASTCDYGKILYEQGNNKRAYNLFKNLAKSGDACGQYYLGIFYYHGIYVKVDNKKAAQLFKSAKDNGFIPSPELQSSIED